MFLAMHLAGNSLVNIFLLQRKKKERRSNLNFPENHTRIHLSLLLFHDYCCSFVFHFSQIDF